MTDSGPFVENCRDHRQILLFRGIVISILALTKYNTTPYLARTYTHCGGECHVTLAVSRGLDWESLRLMPVSLSTTARIQIPRRPP